MALLNKIFSHVGKKKENKNETYKLWESFSDSPTVSVRVLLFRESDSRGKKLLFDSKSVERRELQPNEDISGYTEVNDGLGFIYLPPPKEVKMFSEMILGSVAVTHHPGNMKLHLIGDGKSVLWSSIVQAPKLSQGMKSSDSSLGSSFGCSLGSFHYSNSEDGLFPDIREHDISENSAATRTDSGCFPSFPSFISNESGPNSYTRRRMSSNIDTPDYGSLCSLQRRFLSTMETRDQGEAGNNSLPVNQSLSSFQRERNSKSGSELGSARPGKKNLLLGLGILVDFGSEDLKDILLGHNSVVEDIFSHLLHAVQQAYTVKKRFVITVYNGFTECVRMIENLFTVPRLKLSAWHLVVKESPCLSVQEQLIAEICSLKKLLDTKDTNFLFSTLVTGVLTHHLGWVSTVMPGSSSGANVLNKPSVQGLEQFRNEQWYDPSKVQYSELHGMLGSPRKFAKSLVLCSKDAVSKSLVFVLSYFIRCSLVFESSFEEEDNNQEVEYKPYILRECPKMKTAASQISQSSTFTLDKSSSSPSINQKFHSEVSTLEALDLSGAGDTNKITKSQVDDRKVGFMLGADDNSPNSKQESQDFMLPKDCGSVYSSGTEDLNQIYLTGVKMNQSKIRDSTPSDLSSLMCCSGSYMPGSVLQALNPNPIPTWKSHLQADLLAVAGNSQVSSVTESCVCVVADIDNHEVSLVSAQQVVVGGRPGLPVPMSPLVANLLDNFTAIVELGLSPEDCLNYLEDQLQQIYLESCSLSEYLLSADYTSLQNISKNLQVDPCDIPLLLAVASTHTPAVGKKLSLGYTG